MAISLPDARQLSDEVLQSLRLRALRGCELGYSEIEVAELLGLSRETVSRWWTAYVDHGLEALPGDRTGRPVGSGRTLNDGQAARLRTILNEKSPEEVGIASPLWTRRAVAELIRKEYGIDMPVRTVGEYLERWGYTAKVPRRHAKDQDPEEVRHWLEVTYPAIEARAAREDAEIHWCDETGAAADQQPRRGYAREGRPARIEVPDPHIRMNLISTISNEGSVHFMTYKETMTAALFITFLERMLSETTRKIFLIVDRLRAHEAKKVEAWAAEHRDRIELFFLPRYAPERNADEYLNNDMKGSINATGLPRSQGGARGSRVHDQVAAPAGACSSVLPTPLRQVCCWYLICDHLTCRRNIHAIEVVLEDKGCRTLDPVVAATGAVGIAGLDVVHVVEQAETVIQEPVIGRDQEGSRAAGRVEGSHRPARSALRSRSSLGGAVLLKSTPCSLAKSVRACSQSGSSRPRPDS